jgi:uncharacterized membrane protein
MDIRTIEAEIAKLAPHRKTISKDTNKVFLEQSSLGERVADRVAYFGGSWKFIFLFLGFMAAWMLFNTKVLHSFDPFPYILLNLILSCLAAIQAPVIMMSQNRQAAKDRLDAQHDYEVNLKAELEIATLQDKLDHLHGQHIEELLRMVEQQAEALRRLEEKLGAAGNLPA